jgi:hypothetical protein
VCQRYRALLFVTVFGVLSCCVTKRRVKGRENLKVKLEAAAISSAGGGN